SNPTTISSTIVVRHGTSSSISLGASCPSDCANGPTGSDQWDLVLQRGCQFCFAANDGDSGWDDLVAQLPTAAALSSPDESLRWPAAARADFHRCVGWDPGSRRCRRGWWPGYSFSSICTTSPTRRCASDGWRTRISSTSVGKWCSGTSCHLIARRS